MDNNKPPPLKTFSASSNDLVSRVSSFLPQIEAANKALVEDNDGSNSMLDGHLRLDKDENSVEGSHPADELSSSGSEGDEENRSSDKAPMIQLNLALGNVDDNPEIRLLADDGYDSEAKDVVPREDRAVEQDANSLPAAEGAMRSLLRKRAGESFPSDKATARKRDLDNRTRLVLEISIGSIRNTTNVARHF